MDVLTFTDPVAFAARVQPVIEAHPAFASVLASNLDQTIHGPAIETTWFLLRDGTQAVGAAMHAEPFHLFITPLPEPGTGMPLLAEAVHRAGVRPAGAIGPDRVIDPFVAAWQHRAGVRAEPLGHDRVYEIATPPSGPPVVGQARRATGADLEFAAAWVREFNAEAVPEHADSDAEYIVRRRLARGCLLFWETPDDGPVSMAGTSRPMAGVARIGAVYTPRRYRRQGFGAAVTAAATRQGFADGADRCVLYADLSNPVSNAIYLALGYRPVGDSRTVSFQDSPAPATPAPS